MAKRCIICNTEAVYKIKDTSDYYCEDCARENFSDLSMLMSIEEEAQKLKQYLQETMDDVQKEEEDLEQFISDKGKKGSSVADRTTAGRTGEANNSNDDEDDEDDEDDDPDENRQH